MRSVSDQVIILKLTCATNGVTSAPILAMALQDPSPTARVIVGYTWKKKYQCHFCNISSLHCHYIQIVKEINFLGVFSNHDIYDYMYIYTAMQSQKAVSAYFTSKQILPFGFAVQYINTCILVAVKCVK